MFDFTTIAREHYLRALGAALGIGIASLLVTSYGNWVATLAATLGQAAIVFVTVLLFVALDCAPGVRVLLSGIVGICRALL